MIRQFCPIASRIGFVFLVLSLATSVSADLSLLFSSSLSDLRVFTGVTDAKIVFVDVDSLAGGGDLCYIDLTESNDPPTIYRISSVTNAKVPVVSEDGRWVVYAAGEGGEAGATASKASDVYIVKLEEGAVPVKVNSGGENGHEPRFLQNAGELTVIYPTVAENRQWLNSSGRTKKVIIDTTGGTPTPGLSVDILTRSFTGGISWDGSYVCGGGGNVALEPVTSDFSDVDTIDRFGQACNASISTSRIFPEAVMHLTMGVADPEIEDTTNFSANEVIFITRPLNGEQDTVRRYYVRPTQFTYPLENSMSVRTESHDQSWFNCEWSNHSYYAAAALTVERAYVEYPSEYPDGNFGTVYGATSNQERLYLINLKDSSYIEVLRFANSEFVTTRATDPISHGDILWPYLWVKVPGGFQEEPYWLTEVPDTIPPAHSLSLSAAAVDTSTVNLTWDIADITGSDAANIGVRYQTGLYATSVADGAADSLLLSASATGCQVTGLDVSTLYYFSIFVGDTTGNWSQFSVGSADTARTLSPAPPVDSVPPVHSISLSASCTDTTTMNLSWNSGDISSADAAFTAIRYSSSGYPASIDDSVGDTVLLSSSISQTTVSGLTPSTLYYFGLFVGDTSGNWSDFQAGAADTARTHYRPGITLDYPNGGEILFADSICVIRWTTVGSVDSVDVEHWNGTDWTALQTGIVADSLVWTVPPNETENGLVRVVALSGTLADTSDAVFRIVNPSDSFFITLYQPNGAERFLAGGDCEIVWGTTGPLDSVVIEYRLGSAPWQTIDSLTLNDSTEVWTIPDIESDSVLVRVRSQAGDAFDVSDLYFSIVSGQTVLVMPNDSDTTSLMNDSVFIWAATDTIRDTIQRVDVSPLKLAGFSIVGGAFEFLSADTGTPVTFLLETPVTRQGTEMPLLYGYSNVLSSWYVLTGAKYDSSSGRVVATVTTNDKLIAALADTVPPGLTSTPSAAPPVVANIAISDTITLAEAISNPLCSLICFSGNSLSTRHALACSTEQTSPGIHQIVSTIPADLVNDTVGVVAYLWFSDHVSSGTLSLNKRVRRSVNSNPDDIRTEVLRWAPLTVTATPASLSAAYALRATGGGTDWYSKEKLRLMRWLSFEGNESVASKWVEYGQVGVPDSAFDLTAGKMLWVKTASETDISFGSAVTPSFADTARILIHPKDWTDFGVPFAFPVSVGDIMAASAPSTLTNLEFYKWAQSGGTYTTEAVYLPGIAGVDDPTVTIAGGAGNGYSLYCTDSALTELLIPPTPSGFSSPVAKRKNVDTRWTWRFNVIGADNEYASTVYWGHDPDAEAAHFYPLSRSFGGIEAGVFDSADGGIKGHVLTAGNIKDGRTIWLQVTNTANRSTSVHVSGHWLTLPPLTGAHSIIADPGSGKVARHGDELIVSLQSGETKKLVAGIGSHAYTDEQFLIYSNFNHGTIRLSPNPAKSVVSVAYSFANGQDPRARCFIRDTQGRIVAQRFSPGGRRHIVLPLVSDSGRRLPAGIYTISVQSIYENDRSGKELRQKFLVLP